jgi:hypothetical protein
MIRAVVLHRVVERATLAGPVAAGNGHRRRFAESGTPRHLVGRRDFEGVEGALEVMAVAAETGARERGGPGTQPGATESGASLGRFPRCPDRVVDFELERVLRSFACRQVENRYNCDLKQLHFRRIRLCQEDGCYHTLTITADQKVK